MTSMKGFTVLVAVMIALAQTPNHQMRYSNNWFAYVSGNPYDPGSYTLISFDPGCLSLDRLCAIYVQIDWSTFRPGFWALQSLGIESSNFTQAGQFPDGIIEMKVGD